MQSRIQQGDLVAVAAGTLSLNANGRIEGELQMTVAGIEKIIPALGIDKMLEEGVPQATLDQRCARREDAGSQQSVWRARSRRSPVSARSSSRTPMSASPPASIRSARRRCSEGKKARVFPLRFVDGNVLLGPLKVAQVPPLF